MRPTNPQPHFGEEVKRGKNGLIQRAVKEAERLDKFEDGAISHVLVHFPKNIKKLQSSQSRNSRVWSCTTISMVAKFSRCL